jgi:two-component sensor histidine kinase
MVEILFIILLFSNLLGLFIILYSRRVERKRQLLKRAQELASLERVLFYYEHTLHHRIKASLARTTGLANLLNHPNTDSETELIKHLMKNSLDEMDTTVKEIAEKFSTVNSSIWNSN